MSYLFYNIKKHNYIRFSSVFPDAHEYTPKEMYNKIFISFKIMIAYFLNRIRGRIKTPSISRVNEILILEGTLNQKKSLLPVYKNLDTSIYTLVGPGGFGKYLPWQEINAYSCIYFLTFLFNYWLSTKDEKRIVRSYFDDFFFTIGTIVMAEKLIKRKRTKLVIMANDHSMVFRAFKEATDRCHVPTIYLQHASITYRFPSLQFSYSFLDGMDSYIKYSSKGNMDGEVFLSGSPRFDVISDYKSNKLSNYTLGIALNEFDDEIIVKNVCLFLIKKGYKYIIVRPHPSMEIDIKWYLNHGIKLSDSKKELSFAFLSNISLMISGESGIHLDAALMNVKSICYAFNNDESLKDWYSFQEQGLYPYVETFDSLLHEIERIKANGGSCESDALYYNASHGLPINGHIGDTLADFIVSYLNDSVNQFRRKYDFVEVMPHVWCYSNYCSYFYSHIA